MNLAKVLNLTRPLMSFDLESTGVDPYTARIVQIAITMHYPTKEPIRWQSLVNPCMPIPAGATAVHHITDEMVANAPKFADNAVTLASKLINVDYAGYNILSYDLPLLRAEFKRALVEWNWENTDSRVIDVFRLHQNLNPRNLAAAYKQYVDPRGFEGAHEAGADVLATEQVLAAQLESVKTLPRDVIALAAYLCPPVPGAVDRTGKLIKKNGVTCFNFGKKYNGRPVIEADAGFIRWFLENDFPDDAKDIVRSLREKV